MNSDLRRSPKFTRADNFEQVTITQQNLHGVDFCKYLRDALAGRANIALLTAAM